MHDYLQGIGCVFVCDVRADAEIGWIEHLAASGSRPQQDGEGSPKAKSLLRIMKVSAP